MATIAEERAANARARAEGYESAAHKEAHANVGASAAGYANAVQQEIDANRRAQAEGFANAAAKEMDANRRSVEAGFTSAVDQEIDANRRAREAGYLNAADYESGLRTLSDAPFVDPRTQPAPVIPEQFRIGTANSPQYNRPSPGSMHTAGPPKVPMSRLPASRPLNYAMPTFQGPDYYNQMFNRPLQNWSQFMPANSRLAGGGGALYQNPWGYGTGGGSGWGGAFGGGGMMGGGMMGGGYPGGGFIGGGGYPGGGPFPGGSWFPGGGGGNTTTDASGNQWVMSSSGQWVPAGSEYGQGLLGDARLFDSTFYDSSGNYIGSEGPDVADSETQWGSGEGFGVLEKYFAQPSYVGDDPSYVDIGPVPTTGLLNTPLADKQAYMDMVDITGQPGASFNDFSAANPYAAGPPGASWNDFSTPLGQPQMAGPPGASFNDFSAANPYAAGPPGASFNDFSAANPYAAGPPGASFNDFSAANPYAEAQAAQAQAAANAAAIAEYGGGDYGFLGANPDVGAEVDWGGGPDDFM
jgi:hypothetical protein